MSFKTQKRIFTILRYSVLFGLLSYLSYQLYAHVLGNKAFPSVHGLCPFGGLESLLAYVSMDGATLSKIFSGTMMLFFVLVALMVIFNRAFCGMICSFGALQELFGNIGQKLLKRKFLMPAMLDKVLRYFKYLVLILTVGMAWLTGTLWFAAYDPWTAYGHLANLEELMTAYLFGFIVLLVSVIGSFFYERFFCKYLCPLGAVNAIVGRTSRFLVKRDPEVCINCNLCTKACPVNIDVAQELTVRSVECISCGKCIAVCPQEGALDFTLFKKRVKPVIAILLVIAVYFGGIFFLQLLGFDRYTGKAEANLREMAVAQDLSISEFKVMYALPSGLPGNTKVSAIEAAIPFSKMAELNGLDPASLKTKLGLSYELPDNTPWGEAYGQVTLQVIAGLNGTDLGSLLEFYGLAPETSPETQWKDVKTEVEKYLSGQDSAQDCEGGSCEGE